MTRNDMEENYKNMLQKIEADIEVYLKINGRRVMDSRIAEILEILDRKGSLLAACRETGFPYSRAWEWLMKLEKFLKLKIVEAKRGGVRGGGMKLTKAGKALLEKYWSVFGKYKSRKGERVEFGEIKLPEVAIMGSHDPLLEKIIEELKKAGLEDLEVSWIGSAGGLAAIMIGDADIAGVHLLDPKTGEYNIAYLPKYWLENRVVVYRGYMREIGFVYRRDIKVRDFRDIIEKKLRFINRNVGSGTRVLIDYFVEKLANEYGKEKSQITMLINGYEREVKTHTEICRLIAEGEADAGVALKYTANMYNLGFTSLTWEWYDFVIAKSSLQKYGVREFIKMFKKKMGVLSKEMDGYKTTAESGKILVGI